MNTLNQPILKKGGLIFLMLLLSMTSPLSTDMYLAAFPTLLDELHTNSQMLNYTLVGFFAFYAIGMLLFGPLSDKYGRKPVLLCGIALYSLASLGCAFIDTVEQLIVLRILEALGAGSMVSIATAIIKDSFNANDRAKTIALIQMLSVFAPTLAPVIGAFIIKYATWRTTFFVLCGLSVGSFLLTTLYRETLQKENRLQGNIWQSFIPLGGIFTNNSFMLMILTTGMSSLIYMGFIAVSSYIYVQWFGLSETNYSLFFAINSLVLILGPFVFVRVRNLISGIKLLYIGLTVITVSGILISTIGVTSPLLFLLCFMPITFSNSFLRTFATNVLLGQPNMSAGASASVINFSYTALGSVGMIVGALAWDNFVIGLGTIAICAGITGLTLWFMYNKLKLSLEGLS